MSKQLLLMRHAKSSWKEPGLSDHDRPLNGRGKRDALRAGEELVARGVVPDLIITSTAKRARKTAQRLATTAEFLGDIWETRSIYLASVNEYAMAAAESPDEVQTLLMIGHNPTTAAWLAALTGAAHDVPTATIASITLELADWSELSRMTRGSLEWLWYPKLVAE